MLTQTSIDVEASGFWSALYAQWRKAKLPHESAATKERIVRAILKKFPEAEGTLLVLGAEKAMSKLAGTCRGAPTEKTLARRRQSMKTRVQNQIKDWEEAAAEERILTAKAASFDRMVAALDAITVGHKLLGDCTGADLLREAHRLETIAGGLTAQAVFYRELAAIAGKTNTVRSAADRIGVVRLLTTHFKEAD